LKPENRQFTLAVFRFFRLVDQNLQLWHRISLEENTMSTSKISISRLQIEHLRETLGIGTSQPRLSRERVGLRMDSRSERTWMGEAIQF
jgi:hypothetical protein